MRRNTYRILVLNSTAMVCAIVLSLLTNSMPASRATAIFQSLNLSLSCTVPRSLSSRLLYPIRSACLQRVAIAFAPCLLCRRYSCPPTNAQQRNLITRSRLSETLGFFDTSALTQQLGKRKAAAANAYTLRHRVGRKLF